MVRSRLSRLLPTIGATAVLVVLPCIIPCPSAASTVRPSTLETRAKLAKTIFAGTVSGLQYGTRAEVGMVTTVRFHDVKVAKGVVSDSIELTVCGGRKPDGKGGTLVGLVDGLPEFEAGKRYIVFTCSEGTPRDGYMPIIALGDGVFLVHPDSGDPPVVHDWSDRPLTAVTATGITVVDRSAPRAPHATHDPGDTVMYSQPSETTGRTGSKPLGRLIGVKRQSRSMDEGVPRVVQLPSGEEVLRVLPRHLDNGRRVTEAEFLNAVKGVVTGE